MYYCIFIVYLGRSIHYCDSENKRYQLGEKCTYCFAPIFFSQSPKIGKILMVR